jgi:hypothetical protein
MYGEKHAGETPALPAILLYLLPDVHATHDQSVLVRFSDSALKLVGSSEKPAHGVIYFATAETIEHPLLEFFSFATGKVSPIATVEKKISYFGFAGLDVSPDGRYIIWQQLDQEGSDIMLMENFRWP